MTPPAASSTRERDDVARAFADIEEFAEILKPEDVDEPILARGVAHAVHEWLVELNHIAALSAVKVKPRSLALLYGPPGTGKTTLAHHLAARLGLPLVVVRSELLTGMYLGQMTRNVGSLFDRLKKLEGHCVVLLDEFDAIGQKRVTELGGGGAGHERNHALTVMLQRIEAFRGVGLAATNTKEALDPAIWRRFGLQISVDLPEADERFAILRKYGLPFDLDDAALDVLVNATRGCSPSLLRQLMEGMKRNLILGPRLNWDVSRPERVFERIIAAIAPPPEMTPQPPLWLDSRRALDELKGISWPPTREAQG